MVNQFQHWSEQLTAKIPEKRVILVPAHALVCQRLEKPAEIGGEDLGNYVQLALEGISPFPVEQLLYGYLTYPDSKQILVYATPRNRLGSLGLEEWEDSFHILPDFLPLLSLQENGDEILAIASDKGMSMVRMESNSQVPERVIGRPFGNTPPTSEFLTGLHEKLRSSLSGNSSESSTPVIWKIESIDILPDSRIRFFLRSSSEDGIREREAFLPSSENAPWALDLRDSVFAKREEANRRRGVFLWRGLLGCGILALLLLFLQLGQFGMNLFSTWQEKQILGMEGRVNRVQNKLTLAERLTQSTEADVKPYLVLDAINPFRPDTVYYTRVRARSFNEIEIEGESTAGINPVNAFADALQKLPYIASVENSPSTRANKTSFEMRLVFSDMPPESPKTTIGEPETEDNPEDNPEDTSSGESIEPEDSIAATPREMEP
jgi:hypothetical protein